MNTRINLGDLKSQIIKRVGPDRAQRYFSYLSRLLSQKLSKVEFNKLCLLTLGQDNIPLHNQLIFSIFKNACQAKAPPMSASVVVDNNALKLSNGEISKRNRTGGQRIKDRPSPLGPNGRIEFVLAGHSEAVVKENGDLVGICGPRRSVQNIEEVSAEQPAKRSRIAEDSSLRSVTVDDIREEFEQRNDLKSAAKVPLQAPLGIPFCPPSVGGAQRPLTLDSTSSSFDNGELCDSEDLRMHMERIADSQSLSSVTVDCANLLNNGLDVYLKRLIKSCVDLVGARSGHVQMNTQVYKQQVQSKPINGIWQGNHMHVQSDGLHRSISLQEFRVAMELNPQQLGEDWPLLLEKICIHSFGE
ncbi:uncharacterized protein A4U43_C01F6590 [Asparagus officinalis]|uniref:Transcriptional coactivator Hfi1/Transcriptional adapter 1 n=1 Tax=Asparagus officinalis TaxID=4686 RepID=A0A5P1FS27_ASPOF|nr:uncharacterized protein LOC109850151 [Asparagus officinalis]ONK79460.1 uncharacterized protein A4U43_C01F6590 [Asparagus officinalis]